MTLFVLICFISIGLCQADVDQLNKQSPTTSEKHELPHDEVVCCECVPFYLCENGTIITDGVGVLELRIGGMTTTPPPAKNVEVCPDLSMSCCLVPEADPSCHGESPTTKNPLDFFTPPPESNCECLPFSSCDPFLVVSDGKGLTSIELSNGRLVNHSKCPHALDVCCYLPELLVETTSPSGEIAISPCECVTPSLCGPDGFIRTDGAGILDLRIGPSVTPKPCPSNPDQICCLPPELKGQNTTDTNVTRLPSTTELSITSPVGDGPTSCECVPPFLCGPDGFIRTDGAGILNLRIGPSVPPKPCPSNPNMVCCLPPELKEKNGTGSDTTLLPSSTELPPFNEPCGRRNYDGIGVRITGFQEGQAQFGEFPWVAFILRNEYVGEKLSPLFVGGASLIHKRVVLTAAHKVKDVPSQDMIVRLGEWDIQSTKETLPYQDVAVEKVIIHPNYIPGPLFHDVALLILEEEARVDFHINPICPAKSLDDIDPSTCVVNGWGVDSYNYGCFSFGQRKRFCTTWMLGGVTPTSSRPVTKPNSPLQPSYQTIASNKYQEIVKSVVLPLVGKAKCQELLRKTRLSRFFNLHSSFMCAGGEEGVDACKGDGGGPLACRRRDDPLRYLQVGITAWGIGCGGKDVPGVYADVMVHYSWIMKTIEEYFPGTQDAQPEKEKQKLDRKAEREEKRKARQERRRLRQQRRQQQEKRQNRRNRERI